VLLTRADSGGTPQQRDELFAQAAAHLALASSADPFDYHHLRNEASLERRWARQVPASDRARHLDRADASYAAAVARAPSVAPLWVEWGNLRMEQRRTDEALDKLEHAVALGRASDAALVCDALLPALGIDVRATGGFAAAEAALRARGLVRLSELYATRAAGAAAAR
jgi:tetratricopeptide (TPR) repeat protein